jgi:hypothetical protein
MLKPTGTDWSVSTNWELTPGGTSGVPATNDDAIMNADEANGGARVTSGMDQGAVDLDSLTLPPLFRGVVGDSTGPLKISADLIANYSLGSMYIVADSNAVGLKIDEVRIQCANPSVENEIGSAATDAGDVDLVSVIMGKLLCRADIQWGAAATLEVGTVGGSNNNATVRLAATGDTLPKLVLNSGMVMSEAVITDAWLLGGVLTKSIAKIGGTVYVGSGAVLNYDYEAQAADGTKIKVLPGGMLNLMNTSYAKTIDEVWEWPDSKILWDPTRHTFTIHKRLHLVKDQ